MFAALARIKSCYLESFSLENFSAMKTDGTVSKRWPQGHDVTMSVDSRSHCTGTPLISLNAPRYAIQIVVRSLLRQACIVPSVISTVPASACRVKSNGPIRMVHAGESPSEPPNLHSKCTNDEQENMRLRITSRFLTLFLVLLLISLEFIQFVLYMSCICTSTEYVHVHINMYIVIHVYIHYTRT